MVLTIPAMDNIKQSMKDKIIEDFTHIAFGSGTWGGFSTNTALGNEVITVARQETYETTNSVIISGLLSSVQGNGNDIKETGTRDGSTGTFQSGRNITKIAKTSSKELWVDEEVEIIISQEEL